jgi:hypothetical protein
VGKTEWRHGAHGTNEKGLTRERRVAPLPGEPMSGLLAYWTVINPTALFAGGYPAKNILRLTFWLRMTGKSVVPAGG